VVQKKIHQTIVHIFAKYWLFIIISLAHSAIKWWVSHHTLTASVHYLVKYRFSRIAIIRINRHVKNLFSERIFYEFKVKLYISFRYISGVYKQKNRWYCARYFLNSDKIPAEIWNISQYLAKIWTRVWCISFFGPRCRFSIKQICCI